MSDFNSLPVADQEIFLRSVILPEETRTYIPVPHGDVIDKTEEMLSLAGRSISHKFYTIADDGAIMSGVYTLAPDNPADVYEDILAVQNSYNKRVTLKYAYGIYDPNTEARLISGEVQFKRKHTGAVVKEWEDVLNKSITFISDHREDMLMDIKMMQETKITKNLAAEINGRLFFNEGVINSNHMTSIKNRFNAKTKAVFDDDNKATLWSYYGYVANAMKDLHAKFQIDNHITTYTFLKIKFGLI